jgi:streptogramin lyase
LSFEANQGQTDPQVRFLSHGDGYALFLTPTQAVLSLSKPAAPSAGREAPPAPAEGMALFMQLVRANRSAVVAGEGPSPGTSNYFLDSDPSQWHTAIPNYSRVVYHGVYPGIDLLYYGNQRQLEYDFTIAPGADPAAITLAFQGADNVSLDDQGDLVLHTSGGDVVEQAPVLYQDAGGGRRNIAGRYVFKGPDQVGFAVGAYDRSRPLTIDPILGYSTYLGGTSGEDGYGIAVDESGNAYVTGGTGSTDFPTTAGAFQTSLRGSRNAFVTKLNASGTALLYSTYLGGTGGDYGWGIAVDGSGNAYVAGTTSSTNFPTTPGAFQTSSRGSFDAFVTKLNASGTGLLYSTYIGGAGADGGTGVAVDRSGNAYLTGYTESTNFPTTPGAFQTALRGYTNAFVTKLNVGGTGLVYSTYLGGTGRLGDVGYGIAVDGSGNAYVTGRTYSANFPTTAGAFQTMIHGAVNDNAFVTKLNAGGTALLYSTYLGGSGSNVYGDEGYGIAVDGSGNAYVTGYTYSTNFPTTAGAFQTTNHAANGNVNAFVTKLNVAGTGLVYSTYLGGSRGDDARGIAVDGSGNAYVTGESASTNFPTTADAFQTSLRGSSNAFVTKLNAAGTGLVYSTYLGGSSQDIGSAIAVDVSGDAYVTGYSSSTNFPTTVGAFQTVNRGINAFVAKFRVTAALSVTTPPSLVTAGVPFAVTVTALLADNSANTGYRGTVHFTSSDPAAALPADYAFTGSDNGVQTFVVTLKTAGPQSLTVTDTADSSISNQAVMTTEFALLTLNGGPVGIATGPDGNLWFAENAGRIGRITPDGGVTEFQGLTANSTPSVITRGPDGNLWFTEFTANRIGRITPTGVVTEFPIPTANANPDSITTGPDGNLWFTERNGNKVGRITPGGDITEYAIPTANSQPHGITAGPDGNLWFAELNGNKIGKISVTGTITEYPVRTANSQPYGITAGPDGNLWFTEFAAGKIARITPGGAITEFALPMPTSGPTVIAVGPDGNVWFSETLRGEIGRITPAGLLLPEIPVPTPNSYSLGLVTGPDGNVWFTEHDANRIGRFTFAAPVAPAAANHFRFTTPASVPAGTPFDVTVTALDAYGNTVTNYHGTVTFSSTDGSALLPPDYTFTTGPGGDNGVHTFAGAVTLFTAGDQTVTATDTTNGMISGMATITVTPAPADHFLISAPATVVSGTPFDVSVTALDPYGNTDTNYTATVTFSTSDGDPAVMLPPNYTFQSTDQGKVTFVGLTTLITLGDQSLTVTDTVSGITGSATVTVAAGPTIPGSGSGTEPTAGSSLPDTIGRSLAAGPSSPVVSGVPGTAPAGRAGLPLSDPIDEMVAALDQIFGASAYPWIREMMNAPWPDGV